MKKENSKLYPVILCGGSGTRLWPLSREKYPKQFVEFKKGQTLFKSTVTRVMNLKDVANPIVVCNKSHRFFVDQNLRELDKTAVVIIEPVAKNTAPAIALAAFEAYEQDSDAILFVLPSDHAIKENALLQEGVCKAVALANREYLVTFGIQPTAPETGYGYIKIGGRLDENGHLVDNFVEKPNVELATQYMDSGNYLWNSGMFVFKASVYLDELKKHAPQMYEASYNAFSQKTEHAFCQEPNEEAFSNCPSDSIDYAVLEKSDKVAVVPLRLSWSDLGTWSSFNQLATKDANGNATFGDTVSIDSTNCYLHSTQRLIATVGIDNLAVVESKDAVFIAPLNRCQEVKEIVAKLKGAKRVEAQLPSVVQRPWGTYESLATGEHYQTKRIIVNPGHSISLQLHHRRSEHWTVVEGVAAILVGNDEGRFTENESVYIPKETVHRLTNKTSDKVVVIEVQSGDYLGEDDIVRLEDNYGRV